MCRRRRRCVPVYWTDCNTGCFPPVVFEQVQDVERRFAHVVLQAPALERGGAAVDGIAYHNAEQIQNVLVVERVVVADRSPEIAALGAEVAPIVDTHLGKDRVIVTVRHIGIVVKEGIVAQND